MNWMAYSYVMNDKDDDQIKDNYYMIFVNNGSKKKQFFEKRQETHVLINNIVHDLQGLIIENIDTYKDPEKLVEIEKSSSKYNKRENESWISNLVYTVSTVEDSTVLYAYLSNDLVRKIKAIAYVKDCLPDSYAELATNYNEEDIKKETKWKGVGVKEYTHMHLSLLSQGKFSLDHIDQYDYNYYYPASAGENIDMIIMDSGFNFNHSEFSNTNDRIARCSTFIKDGIPVDISDKDCRSDDIYIKNHGECVADAAGGLDRGVANKANIYGVKIDIDPLLGSIKYIDIIAGLQYISDHLIRPYKTVINFSFGKYYHYEEQKSELDHYEKLINEITTKGGIIFAAAGNHGSGTVKEASKEALYPCSFENVICVGGVEVMDPNTSNDYRKAVDSNHGSNVNIYAPFDMDLLYQDSNGVDKEKSVEGTSFSSPLTAGVAATLMSEHSEIKFTTEIMLTWLTELGLKDIISNIPKEENNIFINNGKHINYSSNDIYYGCGIHSGNLECPSNEYCSEDGFCRNLEIPYNNSTTTTTTTTEIMLQSTIIEMNTTTTLVFPTSTIEATMIEVTSTLNTIPNPVETMVESIMNDNPTISITLTFMESYDTITTSIEEDIIDEETDTPPIDVGDIEIEEDEIDLEEDEEEVIDLDLYLDEEGNERHEINEYRIKTLIAKKIMKMQWKSLYYQ
ncbi:subtilisin-like protein [Piromyces finnis]|uniref:Subtilisin-like protein n=1 Tax=Piromyces finnis TaxID=1754191 RepID=A0A1Y1VCC4_9FUNG|nr:subtilisin-like protein [Piromyces finnis]|eukprot:ORX52624.1 subtilisin-like protein [Piromyces finnis]